MRIKFYFLLVFIFIGMCAKDVHAQANKKVSLLHFTMPDNVPANGTFKVQGYVKNTGHGTIPHGLRLKYMIKAPIGTSEEDWDETEYQSLQLPHLQQGDSIYVERTFQASSDIFSPGRSNIVIIWPTVNLVDDHDTEVEKNVFVYNGTGGALTSPGNGPDTPNMKFPEEGITKLRIMIPATKNRDAAVMECIDSEGNIVAQQLITDKKDNSHLFSIAGLIEGRNYTLVIKDEQGNILQQTPIRKR